MRKGAGKRILLAGATGYIGRHVLDELLRRGYEVTAIVRGAGNDIAAETISTADLADSAFLDGLSPERRFDAVVSCIASRTGVAKDAWAVDYQGNRNLLAAAIRSGASQFVLLSAICVQRPRLAFQHAKLAFESELIDSGLEYNIVRPTAYFKSLAGQIGRVLAGKPYLLFGNGDLTSCKPISEKDLADYLVDCLGSEKRRNKVLPVGGPGKAITPKEQGDYLFELAGIPPRFKSVSPKILAYAAALTRPIGSLIPAVAEKSELARIGHYYATESMLVWNAEKQSYDADATPSFGSDTLYDFYQQALAHGLDGQELGAHKLF